MDDRLRAPLTEDEYLALEEKSDEKHEYVNGEMIAMAGGDPVHAYLASNVTSALGNALRSANRPCRVFSSDLRVSVFSTRLYTYPDITVVCGQPERHPKSKTTIINPTLVVEVLSPSTESWDRGGKFDDGNPCTDSSCDATSGCVATNNAAPCSDGLFCTVDDGCADGACSGKPRDCSVSDGPCAVGTCTESGCEASPAANGAECDDGLACTASETCVDGACLGKSTQDCCTSSTDCDDANPCTADSCDAGLCVHAPAADATACDDGLYCTTQDACSGGACTGSARDCSASNGDCAAGICDEAGAACVAAPKADGAACADDGDACTADACAGGACVHPATAAPCDDGVDCTYNDVCLNGACAGTPYVCDEGLDCASDVCTGDGQCTSTAAEGHCVIAGVCVANGLQNPVNPCERCKPSASTTEWSPRADSTLCPDDGNPCTFDACTSGACEHEPNLASCNDGDPCTSLDSCQGGTCAGSLYDCDDGKPCTSDACDGLGGCTHAVVAGLCLVGDACYAAQAPSPQNPCAACNPATSQVAFTLVANGASCSDGSACTAGDVCLASACTGAPVSCDDATACTDDGCDPATGCTHVANTAPCNDNLYCTVNDTCAGGTCQGAARDCGVSSGACSGVACNDELDACGSAPKPDGTVCDDGKSCHGPDVCASGVCAGAPIVGCCKTAADCDDQNPCTTDTCDATGTCVNDSAPLAGTSCDDLQYCTVDETCTDGACTGKARDCSALTDACNAGTCDDLRIGVDAAPERHAVHRSERLHRERRVPGRPVPRRRGELRRPQRVHRRRLRQGRRLREHGEHQVLQRRALLHRLRHLRGQGVLGHAARLLLDG